MGNTYHNRLANIFDQFAYECEFTHRTDNEGAEILIPVDGTHLEGRFEFDITENSYSSGFKHLAVDTNDSDIYKKILTTIPNVGVTERIFGGILTTISYRTNLKNLSEMEVRQNFMDTIGREAEVHRTINKLLSPKRK